MKKVDMLKTVRYRPINEKKVEFAHFWKKVQLCLCDEKSQFCQNFENNLIRSGYWKKTKKKHDFDKCYLKDPLRSTEKVHFVKLFKFYWNGSIPLDWCKKKSIDKTVGDTRVPSDYEEKLQFYRIAENRHFRCY